MLESDLRERAEEAFARALGATSGRPELAELDAAVVRAKSQLDAPMTVAVVGRIKAGKSTMTNALLGRQLAAMGAIECTYNVNWFHYGDTPSVHVHYRDGRPPETRSPDELDRLTRRSDENAEALAGIDYIDVHVDSPLLRRFSLVDTPGLDSALVTDSENTTAFLGLAREITERTQHEARNADAVLYLFSRALSASGASVIEEFQGPTFGRATPLNAIGVLTKVDTNWRSADAPLERGLESCSLLMRDPAARRLFFAVRPVCALVAFGGETLGATEYSSLQHLAAELSSDQLRSALATKTRFTGAALSTAVDPALRETLWERLGPYGVFVAAEALRAGTQGTQALAAALYRASGMLELAELIVSHFGNRALLIKLERIVAELRAQCLRERGRHAGADLSALLSVDDALDRLWVREHGFSELAVLRRLYEGALDLTSPETEELLRVTGESGTSLEERLGAEAGTPARDLVTAASRRIAYWSLRADAAHSKATSDAAKTLRRSYERLASIARASDARQIAGGV